MKLDELRNIIDQAAQSYYRTGNSPMSDAEYDSLIQQLKAQCPTDIRLTRIGIPYSTAELRDKIEHPFPMGSLDNTENGIDGFTKWYNVIGCDEICTSLKVDGSSIRIKYHKGRLIEAATRGNGAVGEIITANVVNFINVPVNLPEPLDLDIRGEAILFIEEYKDIKAREAGCNFDLIDEDERSNPRNVGNGILCRDDGLDTDKMRFLAFDIKCDQNFSHEADKLAFMQKLGFDVVPHHVCTSERDVREYYNTILRGRENLPFEIDGLVVTANDVSVQNGLITDEKSKIRPKYAKAVKFPHKLRVTTIEDVIVSVGHTGAIVPTAVLKQVRIGGVNVTHALLNNWDEIYRLDISIGDKVEVILAGDIIPKITRVVEKCRNGKKITEPKECPSCQSPTTRNLRQKEGAVTYCTNSGCPEASLQKIKKWIGGSKSGVGILGIGDVILQTLWDNEIIKDPADLYNITVDAIKNLKMNGQGRIGTSRAEDIVNNIQQKRCLSLSKFLGSLGIELLGSRRVELLCKVANGQLDNLSDWTDGKLLSIELDGLGETMRESIVQGLDIQKDLIHKLLKNGVTIDNPINSDIQKGETMDKTFENVTFCFTGTRECMDEVIKKGGSIKNTVAKSKPSPDYLVQKNPLSTSSKSKNAEINGHTKIISLDFLRACLEGKADLGSAGV